MNLHRIAVIALAALSCAIAQADPLRDEAVAQIKRDFRPRGSAGLDRLTEDDVQAACNSSGNHPAADVTKRLTEAQLAGIKYPTDGQLMGDWKNGEKIAQNGRGFTWSDKPGIEVGGNCYNCHQIGPKEMSYGTVGPSLYELGKHRGSGPDMQRYVYGKIYNAKAFNLCSAMPRFGHIGALTEQQIKDLVALLLDPASPVNQ